LGLALGFPWIPRGVKGGKAKRVEGLIKSDPIIAKAKEATYTAKGSPLEGVAKPK